MIVATTPDVRTKTDEDEEFKACYDAVLKKVDDPRFHPEKVEDVARRLREIPGCQKGIHGISPERVKAVFDRNSDSALKKSHSIVVWVNKPTTVVKEGKTSRKIIADGRIELERKEDVG